MALIRQALGSVRDPVSQQALGVLVQQRTGVKFDQNKISRIERGVQDITRREAIAIASVDPVGRGAAWLLFGSGAPGAEVQELLTAPANEPDEHTEATLREIEEHEERRKPRRRPGKGGK